MINLETDKFLWEVAEKHFPNLLKYWAEIAQPKHWQLMRLEVTPLLTLYNWELEAKARFLK